MSYVDQIAQAMRDVGNARARGVAANGQAFGGAVADMGALASHAYQQQQAQQIAQQESQLRAAQLAESQQRTSLEGAAGQRAATTFDEQQKALQEQQARDVMTGQLQAIRRAPDGMPRIQLWSTFKERYGPKLMEKGYQLPEVPTNDDLDAEIQGLSPTPPPADFTLNPGDVRYKGTGQQIAANPKPVETPRPSYQQKDVLLDGKPAIVSYDPSTGNSIDGAGNNVTARVRPIPPASSAAAGPPAPVVIKPGTQDFRTAQDLAYGKLTMADFQKLYGRAASNAPLKAALYDQARQLNPNFNPAAFEMGFKFASQPKVQQQLSSLDNVVQAVPDLIKISDAASRSGITALNGLVNKGGYLIGDKRYSNFSTAQTAFADELSGALGYGSATDMSREMGFNMTDKKLSPANFAAGLTDVVIPFINRKRSTMLNQMGVYGEKGMNPAASAPTGAPPPTAPAAAAAAPPAGRIRVVGPNGQSGTVPANVPLPAGWSKR